MFSPGKLYCIPPATACKGIRLKGVEQLYLHFQVGSPFLKNKPGVYELNTHSALRKSLEQLWQGELSFSPSPKSTLLCTQVISHSLVTIYDQVLHENEIDARIMSSINAMRFKLSQKLSIDTLAKKQGLAPTSYIRLFKKEVGVSPHQFIIQLRIEKAKLLLQSTAMSIEDIAENTGFVDRFHFSKVFLQNAGKTPVAFRK